MGLLRRWAGAALALSSLLSTDDVLVAAKKKEETPDPAADIRSIQLRTHSLDAPYLDSDMNSRWFDFGGDTVVRTDQYIRLTPEKPGRTGWIFSRVPLTATNWEVEIEFKIHGQSNLYGDGMAIWLTKQRAQPGGVFGHVDKFEGLGIFIDTYKNNRPGTVFPWVMAMLGDGSTSYDNDHDGKDNELAGCSARGIRNRNNPTKARITYFHERSLTLELNYKPTDGWTECFNLTDVKVPSVAYLGFSAETGELADNHDIISVTTKNLYKPGTGAPDKTKGKKKNAQTLEAQKPGKKGKKEQLGDGGDGSSGGWGWFFLKFIIFGVLVAASYVGFTIYRTSKRGSRF